MRDTAPPTAVFPFEHTYAEELPGCYVPCEPTPVQSPHLLFFNRALADALKIDTAALDETALAATFAGNCLPAGAKPIAQAYAGHQFGYFSPQLGDGRALLLGEVVDGEGKRRDIALKGSGRTPFSRRGDGKAAIGPMLREVLIGEAMHALGIPTTRALAVVATGEPVYRERPLPGAVLTRVADSHIRVGTFEYFAARGDVTRLRQLADYTIRRHDPALADKDTRHADFLAAVTRRQAALVAQWMNVGFIHGVMNTDNMSIAGETIDYGPCAFMEAYDPAAVFSAIDEFGRYAYGNQPAMAHWNLVRLAVTLLPLLDDERKRAAETAQGIVDGFHAAYQAAWLAGMRAKLGLREAREEDSELAADWLRLLQADRADFTLAWRHLADAAEGRDAPLRARFTDQAALSAWLERWQRRSALEAGATPAATRATAMRQANPWLIPRNHQVEAALAAASEDGDLAPFLELLEALKNPYAETPAVAHLAEPADAAFMAGFRTFCGT